MSEIAKVSKEYKVLVWSNTKNGFGVGGVGVRDTAGIKKVLARCNQNKVVSGQDWDTSNYKVLSRTVTYTEWEEVY